MIPLLENTTCPLWRLVIMNKRLTYAIQLQSTALVTRISFHFAFLGRSREVDPEDGSVWFKVAHQRRRVPLMPTRFWMYYARWDRVRTRPGAFLGANFCNRNFTARDEHVLG